MNREWMKGKKPASDARNLSNHCTHNKHNRGMFYTSGDELLTNQVHTAEKRQISSNTGIINVQTVQHGQRRKLNGN